VLGGGVNIALIIFVIIYVASIFLLLRPLQGGSNRKKGRNHPASNPWHAVSLACDSQSCQGLTAVTGQRFLVKNVPEIPLSQCTSGPCACRYVHHEDRRVKGDRRAITKRTVNRDAEERRRLGGRRKSDWSLLASTG